MTLVFLQRLKKACINNQYCTQIVTRCMHIWTYDNLMLWIKYTCICKFITISAAERDYIASAIARKTYATPSAPGSGTIFKTCAGT